jgi:aminobenzoyl-glutamate transport protein
MGTNALSKTTKKSFLDKILNVIEVAGNKLPDIVTLFVILAVAVVILSFICSKLGVSAIHPVNDTELVVKNLLSKNGIRSMISEAVTNFSGFAPLGMVLVAIIGAGAAEKSGFLAVVMNRLLGNSSPKFITFAIVFVSINGNLAGDTAFIIIPPLAALIFLGIGRHPLLGLYASYAGVAAGFCANITIGLTDALAYGYTEAAAKFMNPDYTASPAINYYFLLVSCILLSIAGTIITEKFMAPRFEDADLSKYDYDPSSAKLTAKEKKGVRIATIALLITIIVLVLLCLGKDPLLADPDTHSLLSAKAPLMTGIIVIISVLLFVPGATYGIVSGKFKNDKELFASVADAFKDMTPYILLCFFCAQFTNYLAWSNLGVIIAVKGAALLRALHFEGAPLLIGLVIVFCIVNLFIGSAAAKWAILAPIFVPMMMILKYDPAVTQVAYRIGDSITNPLSPLFYCFPLILGFARHYEKEIGMGTIIANMIPYSFTFAVVWIIQLVIWILLKLPLGPGGNILLS